jgi:hypothetical protein
MSTWTITTGHGGHLMLPDLAERRRVEPVLSPAAKKSWARAEALTAQHADLAAERARLLNVEVPAAEQARHEHAVEAVRAGRQVEHAPTVAALRERADRLTVEADAVAVVLTEALAELREVLVRDQSRMVKGAFEATNKALTDTTLGPEEALETVQLLSWVTFVDFDPTWPSDLPEAAAVAAARATLAEAPSAAARRIAERAVEAGLLGAKAEAGAA